VNRHHLPASSVRGPLTVAQQGCFDSLARWLIAHAARFASPPLAERLEEEWLAALEERRGAVARLGLARGCCWATGGIAHEQAGVAVLAATSPASPDLLGALSRREPSLLPSRTAVIFVIVCLHVLAISALVTGFAWTDVPHREAETMVDLTYQ
jgi:hypothetical protein